MSNKNKKISIIKFSLLHSINRTISFIRSNLFVILFSAITLGIIIIHIPLCKSLKFIDDQNISIILSVIIGALSSILGIVVAIQLVAFEILRRTFYSFAFKEFFNSNQSKYLFERLILTICVSSISLFILTRPISDRNYLLTYLSFSLFIYCLLILFPATKRMIILSRSREKIIEIISKIDSRAISDFNYFRPGVPTNEQMDIIENNPFFIISDVCVRSINEEDCITPRFILIKANSKLLFLLKHCDKGQEAREIINTFFMIYISAFNKAVSLNQIGTIHSILSIIEEIQHHCAKNNFAWYSMIEMNENFENILFKLIENNNIELTKRGIWILERAYIKHLIENTAPEDEIWILNDLTNTSTEKVEHDKSNQWTTISSDLLYKLSNVIERAISLQKFEIISTGIHSFVNISSVVISSKIGNKKKNSVIQNCYYYASTLSIECAENDLTNKSLSLIPLYSLSIFSIIDESQNYSKSVLIYFGNTFIEIARRNKLPFHNLNDIGATGRMCILEIEKTSLHKEATIYLVSLLSKLYCIVNNGEQLDKGSLLKEIYNQARSIRNWFKGDEKIHKDFLSKIDEIIGSININEYKDRVIDSEENWPIIK